MRSFNRLLVLLGTTTPARADVCASTADDHNSMLQISQRQARPPSSLAKADATQAMLQSIKGVAKTLANSSSESRDPAAVRAAITIANTAATSMVPTLDEEHRAAQRDVDRQFHEYEACGDHVGHGALATAQNAETLQTEEDELGQCNRELATARQSETQSCDAWSHLVTSLSDTRPAYQHPSTNEGFYEHFNELKTWVVEQEALVESRRTGCIDATSATSAKEDECATQAADYETAFCQHRLSCTLLNACQVHEAGVYEDLVSDARATMSSRQEQYRAVKQIECVLALITPAIESGTTISSDDLDNCDGDSDDSHLLLSFPTLPTPEQCPAPSDNDPTCSEVAEVSDVEDGTSGAVALPQPLSHYRFDDLSGSQVTDSGSLGFHGTIVGTESEDWELSQRSNGMPALHLKQGNGRGFVDLGMHENPLARSPAGTLSFWIKSDSYGGYKQIYIVENSIWLGSYDENQCPGRMGFDLWPADASNWIDLHGGCRLGEMRFPDLTEGEWTHIAVTWDPSGMTAYTSAESQAPVIAFTASVPSDFTLRPGQTPRGIGARGQGNAPFRGYIGDFRIYDQKLTADQIQTIVQQS